MPARESRVMQILAGGSGLVALGGLAAIVLSILGLVNVAPRYTIPIAAIVIGAAMLVGGMAAVAELSEASAAQEPNLMAGVGGGVSLEVLGGISAVVLGILALVDVAPEILLPVAALVIGGGMIFSANVPARMVDVETIGTNEVFQSRMVGYGSGIQVVIGLSVIVLGILALVGVAPAILTLVAFLAAAVSQMLGGLATGGTATARISR